jgi:hypothetical protein
MFGAHATQIAAFLTVGLTVTAKIKETLVTARGDPTLYEDTLFWQLPVCACDKT